MKFKNLILLGLGLLLPLNVYCAEGKQEQQNNNNANLETGKSLQDFPKELLMLMVKNDLAPKVQEVEDQVKRGHKIKITLQNLLFKWRGLFTANKYFRSLYDELLNQPDIRAVLLRLTLESKLQKYVNDLEASDLNNNNSFTAEQINDLKGMINPPINPIFFISYLNDIVALQGILPLIKELKLNLLNVKDSQGQTSLSYALMPNAPHNDQFIKLLLDNGAEINSDIYGLLLIIQPFDNAQKIGRLILPRVEPRDLKEFQALIDQKNSAISNPAIKRHYINWKNLVDYFIKNQDRNKTEQK